jgi:hypothetical protein
MLIQRRIRPTTSLKRHDTAPSTCELRRNQHERPFRQVSTSSQEFGGVWELCVVVLSATASANPQTQKAPLSVQTITAAYSLSARIGY